MEKRPKQRDFDRCVTQIEFDTVLDIITCVKTHYKGDDILSVDTIHLDLRILPFQTALAMACEYVRSVALVDYEKGK